MLLASFIAATCFFVDDGKAKNPDQIYDAVISEAHILDGTGNPWFLADVAIKDGRIAGIGNFHDADAALRIDATGLYVAPGFIDLHSLADEDDDAEVGLRSSNPNRRSAPNLVTQGVTTAVVNQDGRAPAATLTGQLARLQTVDIGMNVVPLAGHNTIRAAVMGDDYKRPATAEEIKDMAALVRAAMDAGAWGLSSGLEYAPGRWSETAEVKALVAEIASRDGVHISHVRAEARAPMWWTPSQDAPAPPSLIPSLAEVIDIADATGTKAFLSHLKARGADMWGASAIVVNMTERARARGVRVYGGYYPYTSSFSDGYLILIPRWLLLQAYDGLEDERKVNFSAVVENALKDEALAADIRADIAYLIDFRGGADQIRVTNHRRKKFIGKTLRELAKERGVSIVDMAIALQLEGKASEPGGGRLRSFSFSPHDVKTFASQDWIAPVSDAGVHMPEEGASVHPRAYGTFTRHLRMFAIEGDTLTLPDAVRTASALPAQILGLRDRGLIREGLAADLVVFDIDTLTDKATFEDPHQMSAGVIHVFINGKAVISYGRLTGIRPGKVLLKTNP